MAIVLSASVAAMMPGRAGALINFVRSNEPATVPPSQALTVVDINHDERDDVAVVSSRNEVTLLLSTGVSSLTSGIVYSFGRQLSISAAGDLNGDGFPDIVVPDSRFSQVFFLLGTATSQFQPERYFELGRSTFAVAIADFDKAHGNDIAITDKGAGVVYIALNDGQSTPTFANHTQFPVGQGPEDLIVVDMNNDTNLDLVTLNRGGARVKDVTVLLFDRIVNGLPVFTPVANFGVGEAASDLIAGDFDDDGNMDLAMLNRRLLAPNGEVIFLWGNGTGVVNQGTPLTIQCPVFISTRVGCTARTLTTADFDDDGDLDLAITQDDPREGDVADLLNIMTGSNNRNFIPGPVFRTNPSPMLAAVGQFAGDGLPDLVLVSRRPSLVEIFRNVPNNEGTDFVNGQVCQNPNQCLSGLCVDGVCCESTCEEDERCDLLGSEGTCAAIDANRPRGAACETGDECQSGFCVDDTCCVGGACPSGARCDMPGAEGICRALIANGSECEQDIHCRSGVCDAGLCCNEPCSEGRCDLPGFEGICTSLTPTATAPPQPTAPPSPTPTRTPKPQVKGCPGDCGGDGTVSIADLVRGVGIALGRNSLSACRALDTDRNAVISIGEIVAAVNATLYGCS